MTSVPYINSDEVYPPPYTQPHYFQHDSFLQTNALFFNIPQEYQQINPNDSPEIIFDKVCHKYGISQFEKNNLQNLIEEISECKYVLLLDDSGSMKINSYINNGKTTITRWNELLENVKIIIDFVNTITNKGVDIHFLNNQSLYDVRTSSHFINLVKIYNICPNGSTPLTEQLTKLLKSADYTSTNKIVTCIFTDGEPNGEISDFIKLIIERKSPNLHPITLVACTDDDGTILWMNKLDKKAEYVDTVDDYMNEIDKIKKAQINNSDFTASIGTYILKILVGSFIPFYDKIDEENVKACNHIEYNHSLKKQNKNTCIIC
jgi:hypothetical protein